MNATEMWALYSQKSNIHSDYEAWAFGDDPDKLAQLVLVGIKTGTASLHLWYSMEGLEIPKEGEYSVILDSSGEAVCVIKTTRVYTVPFEKVSENHAYKEGEGDRSLAYWRDVHEAFFTKELAEVGMMFDSKMKIVCEEFIRVYP